MRAIPQRELRNDIARVLREVQEGETIQVTVRGRVVAELAPPRAREMTSREDAIRLLAEPVDDTWLDELRAARAAAEDAERDHWS